VITLGPVVLILALGLTTGPLFARTQSFLQHFPFLGPTLFALLPFFLLSMAFSVFYFLMPNTRVQFPAALVGGLVAGLLWQVNSQLNTFYASKVVTYSKIYGTLGLVPLFLLSIYFAWVFLLFGAQVAYAYQNRAAYLQERQAEAIHQRGREFIALRLMTRLAAHFIRGQGPQTGTQMATALGIPTRLVTQILNQLVRARLLLEVNDREIAYAPALPPAQITVHDILEVLRTGQGQELATSDDAERAAIRNGFSRILAAEKLTAREITLDQLAACATPPK
jgi:membrane protein